MASMAATSARPQASPTARRTRWTRRVRPGEAAAGLEVTGLDTGVVNGIRDFKGPGASAGAVRRAKGGACVPRRPGVTAILRAQTGTNRDSSTTSTHFRKEPLE